MAVPEKLDQLLAIEAIKSLKARYFRCMDTKDWQGLGECFSEDLDADFTDAPGPHINGRAEYIAMISETLKDAETVHHGHMPEITLLSETEAEGIWAMDDIVRMPGMTLKGWGHYHERYRFEDQGWVISHIRLTRLILDMDGDAGSA